MKRIMTACLLLSVFFGSNAFAANADIKILANGSNALICDTNTNVNMTVSSIANADAGKQSTVSIALLAPFRAPLDKIYFTQSNTWAVNEPVNWISWLVSDLSPTSFWSSKFKQEGTYVFEISTRINEITTTKKALVYVWESEPIRLVSSRPLSGGLWEYDVRINSAAIDGSKASPFWMGEDTGWSRIAMADNDHDGWYEYKITTYNRQLRFAYGGSYANNSWGTTGYYDWITKNNVMEMYDGVIFKKGTAPFSEPPGIVKDGVVSFSFDPASRVLTVYANLGRINGLTSLPVWMGDPNWDITPFDSVDENGWGMFRKEIVSQPTQFKFNFRDGQNSWAGIADSNFFYINGSDTNLCVRIENNVVKKCN